MHVVTKFIKSDPKKTDNVGVQEQSLFKLILHIYASHIIESCNLVVCLSHIFITLMNSGDILIFVNLTQYYVATFSWIYIEVQF